MKLEERFGWWLLRTMDRVKDSGWRVLELFSWLWPLAMLALIVALFWPAILVIAWAVM